MLTQQYTVKAGDSLSLIAKRFWGNPGAWPAVMDYNNQPNVVSITGTRIVDPNIILVGQKLIIPNTPVGNPVKPPVARPAPPAIPIPVIPGIPLPPSVGVCQPGTGTATSGCSFPTFQYDLGMLPEAVQRGPGWTARVSLKGAILLQEKSSASLITIKQDGFEISAKQKTDQVLDLAILKSGKIEFDPKSGGIGYESGITINSTNPYTPSTAFMSGISPQGKPYVKGTIQAKNLKGTIDNHMFLVAELKVVITIELEMDLPPTARPKPLPVRHSSPVQSPYVMTDQQRLVFIQAVIATAVIVAVVIFFPPAAIGYATAAAVVTVGVGVGGTIKSGTPIGGI